VQERLRGSDNPIYLEEELGESTQGLSGSWLVEFVSLSLKIVRDLPEGSASLSFRSVCAKEQGEKSLEE
jgi:hypothetical protein